MSPTITRHHPGRAATLSIAFVGAKMVVTTPHFMEVHPEGYVVAKPGVLVANGVQIDVCIPRYGAAHCAAFRKNELFRWESSACLTFKVSRMRRQIFLSMAYLWYLTAGWDADSRVGYFFDFFACHVDTEHIQVEYPSTTRIKIKTTNFMLVVPCSWSVSFLAYSVVQ